MGRWELGLVTAALGATFVTLALQTWRANRSRAYARSIFFESCLSLFSHVRISREVTGFPRLAGQYRGASFGLQAVPDTLTFRKLPALWVLVTLPVPLPVSATLDLMMRPNGLEPFTNFNRLPESISTPVGFPADCAIRADTHDSFPYQNVLVPHLDLFEDRRVKELLVSPNGLRITFLAEEADRGRYLLFRDAEMAMTPLAQERLIPLMDRLLSLKAGIMEFDCSNRQKVTV